MVLQGFSPANYVGWVLGILFLQSPKGPPTVPAKRSLHTLTMSVVFIIISLIWIDFHISHLKLLRNEHSVEKFLSLSLFIGATIFDFYFRLCFFFRAKIVARFLKSLESDMSKLPYNRISPMDRKRWKSYRNLITAVQVYHYVGAIITSLWVAVVIPDNVKLLGFVPSFVYPVIFLLFGVIPLVSTFFVSFAFVIVSTFHIQWIFDDFCAYFDEQIEQHEKQILNPMGRDLGEIFSIPSSKLGTNGQILGKLEHLKLLCSQYDKICGPLLLGLLVRAVFILISSANSILLYNNDKSESPNTINDDGEYGEAKKIKLVLNIYHFITEISQLVLLQLGYMIQNRISEKKENLQRKVILMGNVQSKDQMKEAISVICEWNWSISGGPGFFEVNRPLLSGVVSSLMTYVTILFQLNVGGENELSVNATTINNSTEI